jgi:hypothetical protein
VNQKDRIDLRDELEDIGGAGLAFGVHFQTPLANLLLDFFHDHFAIICAELLECEPCHIDAMAKARDAKVIPFRREDVVIHRKNPDLSEDASSKSSEQKIVQRPRKRALLSRAASQFLDGQGVRLEDSKTVRKRTLASSLLPFFNVKCTFTADPLHAEGTWGKRTSLESAHNQWNYRSITTRKLNFKRLGGISPFYTGREPPALHIQGI